MQTGTSVLPSNVGGMRSVCDTEQSRRAGDERYSEKNEQDALSSVEARATDVGLVRTCYQARLVSNGSPCIRPCTLVGTQYLSIAASISQWYIRTTFIITNSTEAPTPTPSREILPKCSHSHTPPDKTHAKQTGRPDIQILQITQFPWP